MIQRSKAQGIHDRDGPGPHGNNVANDSAHPGCGSLKRFDEAWVVVAFDLEGDCPAFSDIDNSSVFSHADHEVGAHIVGDFLAELAKVNFGGLIGAVLAPHHRIHR